MADLRDARRRAFLSQQELADKAGVSRETVHAIESGKSRPYPSTIRAIAEALGVEPAAIDWPERG